MEPIKVKLGGSQRSLRVELKQAPQFEEATGLGYIALYKALDAKTATTAQVAAVIRVALAANGAHYSPDEIFEMINEDGLINAYVVATLVVIQLLLKPNTGARGKERPAPSGNQRPSH